MRFGFLVPLMLLLAAARVAAVEVTQCSQIIAAGEIAELRGHLECPPAGGYVYLREGVRLTPGATLRLNGFTIRGDGTGTGISCYRFNEEESGPCVIDGPGSVENFWAGVNGAGCTLRISDLHVSGHTQGIYAPLACDLELFDVTASDNAQDGIWAMNVAGSRIRVNRNGAVGLAASFRLHVNNVRANENGHEGVAVRAFRRARARLVDSVVTDNGGLGRGVDISAAGRVRLIRTTCGRSARLRFLRPPSRNGYRPHVVGSFGCAND